MFRKSCNFTLNLEIKSVTCPGVWLCTNGYISLTVSTFGTEHETKYVKPIFPLNFHEVFYFKKIIDGVNNLSNLKRILSNETFTCLLIQWPSNYNSEEGKVLSKFYCTLDKLIFPISYSSNACIELMMEPSTIFPGILSPKIEILTMIKVEDVMEPFYQSPGNLQKHVKYVNLNFTGRLSRKQQAVCHSNNYHGKFYENRRNFKKDFGKIDFLCPNISQEKLFRNNADLSLINNKVSRVYQFGNCGVCNEYNRLFENVSLPLGNFKKECDSGLPTYKIFNTTSNNSDDEIPSSLKNRMEKLLSDESICSCTVLECPFRIPHKKCT